MKKTLLAAVAATVMAGGLAWVPAASVAAPKFACSTAKLIVPWKAGGGTHVIFSIFEKTIQNLDVTPKIWCMTLASKR